MREREVKLALPGRFSMPELVLGGSALDLQTLPELDMRATYFDTADLRLARNGVTLRYRTGEADVPGWTLKLPSGGQAMSEVSRDELHFEGPRREPPEHARSLVAALARTEPLKAVATLRTRRRRWRVVHDDEEIAELADDEVSVLEGRRVVSRFRELEVEAVRTDAPLGLIADQLRAAGAIDVEPIPKVVRALGSRATAPPDTFIGPLPDDATVTDAIGLSIAHALRLLVAHDPLARLGVVEGVHQLRVALRRLRSDLATLSPFVEPAWHGRIEPELRRIGRVVGEVRDLDVLTDRLRRDLDGDAQALGALVDEVEARRADARASMARALDEPAYRELLDELFRAAARPPVAASSDSPAADLLPGLVLGAWERLERRAANLGRGSDDERFHRTRIEAKRTRYAAELTARLLPAKRAAPAERFAAHVARAQDQLGVIQDASVAESVIRDALGVTIRDVSAALEAGMLVERARARAASGRAAFLAEWKDLRRRKWRRWLDE